MTSTGLDLLFLFYFFSQLISFSPIIFMIKFFNIQLSFIYFSHDLLHKLSLKLTKCNAYSPPVYPPS